MSLVLIIRPFGGGWPILVATGDVAIDGLAANNMEVHIASASSASLLMLTSV